MFKKFAFLGFAHAWRVAANLTIFVLLAKELGPSEFGVFSFWFATSTLVALATDLGTTNFLLNEIGRNRDSASSIFRRVAHLRLCLSLVVFFLAATFSLLFLDSRAAPLFLLMLAGAIFTSLYEMYLVPARVMSDAGSEVWDSVWLSLVHLATIYTVAVLLEGDVMLIALSYGVARFLSLVVSFLRNRRHLKYDEPASELINYRSLIPYGVDSALTNLSSNLDVIITKILFGVASVGIYQAGARLSIGALGIAPVISSVYLPRLSYAHANGEVRSVETNLRWKMILVGGCVFGSFFLLKEWFVFSVLGAGYESVVEILSWLGLAVYFRYVAIPSGFVLTVAGKQAVRLLGNALSICVLSIVSLVASARFGVLGVAMGLVVSNAFLCIFFGLMVLVGVRESSVRRMLPIEVVFGLVLAMIIVFV